MKTAPSFALLPAALFASTLAFPSTSFAFAEIARGALTLTTTGRVAYDSNISGNATELDDTIFTLAPTLEYSREAGLGSINASLGVAINRYVDLSAFDSEDIYASVRIGLPTPEGAREQGSLTAGYTDSTDINEDVGTRIRSKTWNAGFSGTFRAGPRTNLRANFAYSDTTRDVFSDREQWSAGVGFDYSDFLGGFGLQGDYRYSDTQSTRVLGLAGTSIDQTSHHVSSGLFYRFVNGLRASADVGYRWIDRSASETPSGKTSSNSATFGLRLDGPFLPPSKFPKLKSSFSLGIQQGQTLGLNDSGSTTLVGDLGLSWQARERTSFSVSASRRQDLAVTNQSTVRNSVSLGATQRIGARTSLTASIGQEWTTYGGTGRDDRRTRASLNLGHAFIRDWQAGVGYALTLSRSSADTFDYDRHVVSGFVSYKF